MSLHKKAIENISNLIPFERHKYFIRRIADYEELWTIVDKSGDIALSVLENKTLVSFWADEDFIENNLSNGWEKCVPFKINLEDFAETIIPLIEENNYLINVFPLNGKSGFVVNLEEFARDLNEELDKYE